MFSPPFSVLFLLLSDRGAPVLNHGVCDPSTTVALTFVRNLTKEPKRRRNRQEHLLGSVTEKVGPSFRKSLATFDTVGHYVASG